MNKGTRFYNCDFQVHTPRDINWSGPKPVTEYPSHQLHIVGLTFDFSFVKNQMMTKQERMYRLIERQQASGLTVKAFCEQEQIKLHTFHYWLRKKRQTTSRSEERRVGKECR